VQRAIWIPIIEYSFFRKLPNEKLKDLPFITEEGVDMMISRWGWGAEEDKPSTIGGKVFRKSNRVGRLHSFHVFFCVLPSSWIGLGIFYYERCNRLFCTVHVPDSRVRGGFL